MSYASTADSSPEGHCSTGVLYITTGTPDEPTAPAVKRYLDRFLSDQRIVDLPRWKWQPILQCVILPRRSPKSAERYASIWTEEGSPLAVHTEEQRAALQQALARRGHDVPVLSANLYSMPDVNEVVNYMVDDLGLRRIVVLPCYPQYASVTNGSMFHAVCDVLSRRKYIPDVTFIGSFCTNSAYLDAMAAHIRRHWTFQNDDAHKLLFTFHSTPLSDIEKGDVYQDEINTTCTALAQRLGVEEGRWAVGYQSVFGTGTPWLGPLTQEHLIPELAREGVTNVSVVAPGFTTECLETAYDVDTYQRQSYEELVPGGTFTYVPCIGADPAFIEALADVLIGRL